MLDSVEHLLTRAIRQPQIQKDGVQKRGTRDPPTRAADGVRDLDVDAAAYKNARERPSG